MSLQLPTPVFLWRSTKWLMVQSQHLCVWAGSCACHKGLACHGCSRFGFVVRVWQYPLKVFYFDGELADSLKWNLKMQTVTCETIPWVFFCPSNSDKWWLIWRLITNPLLNNVNILVGHWHPGLRGLDPQFLPSKKIRVRKPSNPYGLHGSGRKCSNHQISWGECYEKLAEPGLLEELQKPRVPEGPLEELGISDSPCAISFFFLVGEFVIFFFFQADEYFFLVVLNSCLCTVQLFNASIEHVPSFFFKSWGNSWFDPLK